MGPAAAPVHWKSACQCVAAAAAARAPRTLSPHVRQRHKLRPHTRKSARFRPRALPVVGRVSDSAIDPECDAAGCVAELPGRAESPRGDGATT